MTRKYKYLFRFGRGLKTVDLLGPSITYFWNDIYDLFDIEREMFVEKLDGKVFSLREIKRLFKDLSEDMKEDFAEIWLEIHNGGRRLRFVEINILPGLSLYEQEELFREYRPFLEAPQLVLATKECRMLYSIEGNALFLFVALENPEEDTISADMVKLLLEKGKELCAKRLMLVTWNDINEETKRIIEREKIEVMTTEKMLKEVNETNLDIALDEYRLDIEEDRGERFTSERFSIYLDQVKSATSNIAKKNTLESLAEFFFSGVAGLKVIRRDTRGPSEELDLLVANESDDAPLKTVGNPIAVECRHRRKPASSKDIRDFRGKLEDAGLKAGILISLKGITGNHYDAVTVIREARKCGISLIVISLEDLCQVAEGKTPMEVIKECFYKYV